MALTAKQAAFVDYYTDSSNKQTYNNATQSAKAAGYKGSDVTLKSVGPENLAKPCVKVAITAKIAKRQAKMQYDYEAAVEALQLRLTYIESAAANGNIQAVQVQTGILRELNDISGHHKQHFTFESDQQRELNAAQAAAADEIAAISNRQSIKAHKDIG